MIFISIIEKTFVNVIDVLDHIIHLCFCKVQFLQSKAILMIVKFSFFLYQIYRFVIVLQYYNKRKKQIICIKLPSHA